MILTIKQHGFDTNLISPRTPVWGKQELLQPAVTQ
jgi:hypothetical protein